LFNSLDPAQDGDSDDSLYLKPNKKKKTDLTDFFAKVPDPSNVDKKPTARKASGSAKPAPKKPRCLTMTMTTLAERNRRLLSPARLLDELLKQPRRNMSRLFRMIQRTKETYLPLWMTIRSALHHCSRDLFLVSLYSPIVFWNVV
jgi:hypothetical protein